MKKSLKMVVCACLLVLAMGLTACGGGKFSSIKEYLESDEVQSQLDEVMKQVQGSGMEMTVTAEDNKLVYTYKFTDMDKTDGMAEQLESGVEAQASTFTQTATELKSVVDVDNPIVTVTYVDRNGVVIYTRDFSAK